MGIAKYDAKGEHFEILVDPDLALEYRLGKPVSIDKILISDTVYRDAKKGLRASESALLKVFKTTDIKKIAEIILKEGEIPLTADQRKKIIEQKKRQIIEWISRNCIDVRTKAPVPPERVENALSKAGVAVDPFKSVEEQIPNILKALQKVLPIKIAIAEIEIKLPPSCAMKGRNVLAKLGRITSEHFESDGSLILRLEIPAGMQEIAIQKVNELSRGEGEVKLIGIRT